VLYFVAGRPIEVAGGKSRMSNEPDNLVLEVLRGIRADVASVDAKVVSLDAKLVDAKAELKADIHSLRADMASDLATMRKETSD
jgi:hypothetical protein